MQIALMRFYSSLNLQAMIRIAFIAKRIEMAE